MRVAGFGFRQSATLASLRDVLAQAEGASGPVDLFATATHKVAATPLTALAEERGLRIVGVDVDGIATETQSTRVASMFGTGSVAEAAALSAAGPGARLVVPRITSDDAMATAAIAESTKGQGK